MCDPLMILETERLMARCWRGDEDAAAALVIYGDPEVTRFIGGHTWADLAEAREGLAGIIERSARYGPGLGGFPLIRRRDGALIGAVLVKYLPGPDRAVLTTELEVGWHLATRYQGCGYATEAGRAVIAYAFALTSVPEVVAVTEPANLPSQRVALRLGMEPRGRTCDYYGGLELEKFVMTRRRWAATGGSPP